MELAIATSSERIDPTIRARRRVSLEVFTRAAVRAAVP